MYFTKIEYYSCWTVTVGKYLNSLKKEIFSLMNGMGLKLKAVKCKERMSGIYKCDC